MRPDQPIPISLGSHTRLQHPLHMSLMIFCNLSVCCGRKFARLCRRLSSISVWTSDKQNSRPSMRVPTVAISSGAPIISRYNATAFFTKI
jgi:hypothetical protein